MNNRAESSSASFRPEIEGLRAVAVLAVVLYHASLGPFRGGYIGVDVFFVVSGALITGLVVDEVGRSGTLSLSRFWARRARRLLPMAMLVLAATVVASRWAVDPLTQGFVDRSALAAIGFVANIVFWTRGGYSHLTVPDPLVHFWSLAVEEQFYLVWPLLLWLLSRLRASFSLLLGWTILVLGLASLTLCILVTPTRQPFAFYWLPTRAWELLVGAGLVVARPALTRLSTGWRAAAAWVGLATIVVCAVRFGDPESGFPGSAALWPVLGTALVVIGASPTTALNPGRLLAHRLLGWIGKRSYSLYLWHLPILVLAAATWGPLSTSRRVALLAVSMAIAALSFALVENPVRMSRWLSWRPRRSLVMGALTASATLVVVFVTMHTVPSTNTGVFAAEPVLVAAPLTSAPTTTPPGASGSTTVADAKIGGVAATPRLGTATTAGEPVTTVPASSTDALAALAAANRTTLDAAVQNQVVPANLAPSLGSAYQDKPPIYQDGCILGDHSSTPGDCVFGDPNSAVTVVLFGDSHAAQWFSAMNAAAIDGGWRLVVMTKMGCPTADVAVTNAVRRPECGPWRANVLARIAALHPDLVVLSAYRYNGSDDTTWKAGLDRTLSVLRPEAARVLVLGDTPTPLNDVPSCVVGHLRDVGQCMSTRAAAIRPGRLAAEQEVAAAHDALFVSTDDWLCTDQYCPVVIGNVLVYRDDSHLTTTAAALLTPYVETMIRPLIPTG